MSDLWLCKAGRLQASRFIACLIRYPASDTPKRVFRRNTLKAPSINDASAVLHAPSQMRFNITPLRVPTPA